MEILKNCRQSAKMTLVRMSQCHHVNLLKVPRPQIRRHRFLARVDPISFFASWESSKRATSIDQQSLSTRRNHEQ
jgi:hypothetical protein